MWNAGDGKEEVRSLTGHTGPVLGVCFSPRRQPPSPVFRIDRTIKVVWDTATWRKEATFKRTHELGGAAVCFSPADGAAGQAAARGS